MKTVKCALHSDGSDNIATFGDALGLDWGNAADQKILAKLRQVAYEVEYSVLVNEKTGKSKITEFVVDGVTFVPKGS